MFVAFDKEKNRIHINQAFVKYDYYCPVCGGKLIIKKGKIKAHHYAHQASGQCYDHWHYDIRFLLKTTQPDDAIQLSDESLDLKWFTSLPPDLLPECTHMFRKWENYHKQNISSYEVYSAKKILQNTT